MIHGFNFSRYNSIYTHHFDFHNTILFLITISITANIKYVKPHVNQVGLHQLYSLIEHIDGTATKQSPYVLDSAGNATSVVNPEFQAWKIKDKALLSLINSTLSPQVFSLVGITSSREVWSTLK